MKILVSGAAGFIGRAVASELLKRGHEVIGLVHDELQGKSIADACSRHVVGDLFEGGAWCSEVAQADKVISLTKPFRDEESIPADKMELFSRKHAEGVSNLIKAASDGKASSVIVTWDTQCLGDREGKWVNDADYWNPIGYCSPIGSSQHAVERTAEDAGLNMVSLYPSMVYGNGGWFKRLVDNIIEGRARIVEPGDNYLSLIHVDDLAALYAEIVEHIEGSETFTLSDDRPVKQSTFIEHVSALLGRGKPPMIDFKSYAKEFGQLEAEMMSSNTRVSGVRAINMFNYNMVAKSYEKGVERTLETMGVKIKFAVPKAA